MAKALSLDGFKALVTEDDTLRGTLSGDIIDKEHGVMRIHAANVSKYLEKYACRDEEDLCDTLYYSYGVFCQVVD